MKNKTLVKKILSFAPALVLGMGVGFSSTATAVEIIPGICGPMDLVLVVDDTGSMGGAIDNIKAELPTIIADALLASGNDLQLALTSFKDVPQTDADLPSTPVAMAAAIAALTAIGGAGGPESSDVALDAVINGAGVDGDGVSCGDLFSNGNFRAGAVKIVVMLTDNLPGGCDDTYTAGVDDANAAGVASDASAAGILISAIYNDDSPDATVLGIMNNYATTTGGQFVNTPSNGTGTATAIEDIIADCGSSANECPLSQGYWKNHMESWPVTIGLEIGGTTYNNAELLTILGTPPKKGNSNLILAHQLIATLLNIANGSDPSVISAQVTAAQGYLASVDLLVPDHQKNTDMNALAGELDEYNNRLLTPDCEESPEEEPAPM